MTRKHFEAVAQIFASEPDLNNIGYANRLADFFQRENPRFDRERFLAAAGVPNRPRARRA